MKLNSESLNERRTHVRKLTAIAGRKHVMRIRTISRRIVASALIGFVAALPSYSDEPEWEKFKDIPKEHKKMGPGDAEYDTGLNSYVKRIAMTMKGNQALTLKVRAYDYEPKIRVRNASGKIIYHAPESTGEIDADGRYCEDIVVEFIPPDDGIYTIEHVVGDSWEEGEYIVQGAVWHYPEPKPKVEENFAPMTDYPKSYAGMKRNATVYEQNNGGVKLKGTAYNAPGHFIEIEVGWIESGSPSAAFRRDFNKTPDNKYTQPIVGTSGNVHTRKVNGAGFEGILVISKTKEARAFFLVKADPKFAATKQKFIALAQGMLADVERRAIDKR